MKRLPTYLSTYILITAVTAFFSPSIFAQENQSPTVAADQAPTFPPEVDDWSRAKREQARGLEEGERLRSLYLQEQPGEQAPLEVLAAYLQEFQAAVSDEASRPDGLNYDCNSFDVSYDRLRSQIDGSIKLSPSLFDAFSGRWYGIWGKSLVNHDWRETVLHQPPVSLVEGWPILTAEQYAWISNGFGWNYLVSGGDSEGGYLLGMVYYFDGEDFKNIAGEKPHLGFSDSPTRLLWMTEHEAFFEEVRESVGDQEEQYVITTMYHDLFGDGSVSHLGTQAIYTRDPSVRPEFREFSWSRATSEE